MIRVRNSVPEQFSSILEVHSQGISHPVHFPIRFRRASSRRKQWIMTRAHLFKRPSFFAVTTKKRRLSFRMNNFSSGDGSCVRSWKDKWDLRKEFLIVSSLRMNSFSNRIFYSTFFTFIRRYIYSSVKKRKKHGRVKIVLLNLLVAPITNDSQTFGQNSLCRRWNCFFIVMIIDMIVKIF